MTVPDTERLEAQFHQDMLELLVREHEVGLNSARFRQMVEEHGGANTAHRLLKPDRELPPTFKYLREIGRTDLAMESHVLKDKYKPLFSDQEREIASWRLMSGD